MTKSTGARVGFGIKQRLAARLLAEDTLTHERISEEVGISDKTLYNWRQKVDFQAMVREYVQELDDEAGRLQFAKRRNRIAALNRQATDYLYIVSERSRWYAENEPDVPGGKSGRLTRTEKFIGTGKQQTKVVEHSFDGKLDAAFDAVMKQIAQERGEWSEKRELSGPDGLALLPIVEVEVVRPAPRELPDDD